MNNLYNIQGKLINLEFISEICICEDDPYPQYKYYNKKDNRYYGAIAEKDEQYLYWGTSISAELKNSPSIKIKYFGKNEIIINCNNKEERDRVFNIINQKFSELLKLAQVI